MLNVQNRTVFCYDTTKVLLVTRVYMVGILLWRLELHVDNTALTCDEQFFLGKDSFLNAVPILPFNRDDTSHKDNACGCRDKSRGGPDDLASSLQTSHDRRHLQYITPYHICCA